MSYMQPQFITFICMLSLGQCLTSKFISQENDRVIIIDQDGTSDLECCMYGNCHCSNLSLALEHIQDSTEIRIQSGIALYDAVVFGNVSNVKITGDSNPTVRCDHQGGLVGKNINYIVIQGITWDSCNGITMLSFTHIHIIECNFMNFALTLHGLGSVNIDGSKFSHNDGNADVLASSIIIHVSKFYSDSKSGSLVIINATNVSGTLLRSINVTIPGVIYIGEGSTLYVILNETSFEFLGNSAISDGVAVYVDLYYIYDASVSHQLSSYYYHLLKNTRCTCDLNNSADIRNRAYFNTDLLNIHFPNVNYNYPKLNVSSSPCYVYSAYKNSTVNVNVANISGGLLKFWLHDLHISVIIYDCYGNPMGPVNASFQCCDNTNTFPYNCTIDSQVSSVTVTSKNSIVKCPNLNSITCKISVTDLVKSSDIYVIVQRFGHTCDDIAHAYSDGICLPICLPYLPLQNYYCSQQSVLPGFWYDNGFRRFVAYCPIGHYNYSFQRDLLYTPAATFPNRNLQCSNNWGGLACGECNYSAGYAIKYDTTECVSVDECLTTSVIYSLLILFAVSLLYWIVIMSFIFVLLHFKFDITAGYAYGLLFYYSVLEQLVNDVITYLTQNLENSNNYIGHHFHDNTIHGYEFMRLKVLPFLSSIGILKPPFTEFMKLCFSEAKVIDHLVLGYIHPLIVTFLVVVIFILARNFVLVARTIGRFVNSKSVCILLLLSYSSVTYNSMQLLKPLPVFNSDDRNPAIQVYWSPTVKYFHDRHLWYGIIAILCELIIGIGIPLVLIFQRYLIRYSNVNFTTRIKKHVIDQLKGCYTEEYYWFSAYYLICRQVLYGVNNLVDYFAGYWSINNSISDTPYPKFTIMLTICILIMVYIFHFSHTKRKILTF